MTTELEAIPRADDALLSARDVETGYGDLKVLNGVDVDVSPEEIVLIFGPNGAGKSTFLKAVFQLLPLWNGQVTMDGADISAIDPSEMISHGVGYVPQTNNIFPNLSISENLDIGSIHTENDADRRAAVYDLFPRLEERKRQSAASLSGGERQMLAMGRALMPDPAVLLIDEPSAGLAPQLIEDTFEHIEQIRSDGTAVLMIEQNVIPALDIADRGYVLDQGETRFEGQADELFESDQIRDLYLGK
jgi:branched-chain amino acid transport system ATP-binding protein